MADPVTENLILDLLESVANGEKTYAEVLDAWRTSCPKLPVWDEANDRQLVATKEANGRRIVTITPSGLTLLKQLRPSSISVVSNRARKS
jgi:hypothetical protein